MNETVEPEGKQIDVDDTSKEDTSLAQEQKTRKGFRFRRKYLVIALLLIAIAVTVVLFLYRGNIEGFEYKDYGYLGVFIICVVSNATIILPVGSALAVAASSQIGLNPVIVGLVGASGAAIGELSGYMAGYGGKGIIEKRGMYIQVERWMQRRGFITIAFFSITALAFDVAGLVAGAFRYPLWKFFLACWLGRSLLYIGYAYLGLLGFSIIENKYIAWGIIGAIVVAVVLIVVWKSWKGRKNQSAE